MSDHQVPSPGDRHVLHPGDKVMKIGDYNIPGEVRCRFIMTTGVVRYAVEHKAEGGGRFVHIYADKNLELVERGFEGKREDASDAEIMTDEGRPSIPPGYSAPLDPRPSRVLIQDRIDNLAAAKTAAPLACWCCDGTGKAFNAIDMCMDTCLICGGKTAPKSEPQSDAAPALFAAARERDKLRSVGYWVPLHDYEVARAESTRLREALEAAVEALGHIPDMRGCLHEAWFSSVEDAPSASSAENEVKSIESIARDALAKALAALGKPSVTENSARPRPPTP